LQLSGATSTRKTPVEAAVSAANEEMQATRLPLQSKQKAAPRLKRDGSLQVVAAWGNSKRLI
jgi:hypothetical protein